MLLLEILVLISGVHINNFPATSVKFNGKLLVSSLINGRSNYDKLDETDSLMFSPYSVIQLLLLISSKVLSVCVKDPSMFDLYRRFVNVD